MAKLDRSFYERDSQLVAIELLGRVLCFQETPRCLFRGKIVETEAYYGHDDPASHACRGRTPRNDIMFGQAGFSYVYFNYGFHYLFNVVTEREGTAGAVLIRALEPLSEIETIRRRRRLAAGAPLEQATNGPAKWTRAFGLGQSHNGLDLTAEPIWIEERTNPEFFYIDTSSRIGIREGQELPYRFFIRDNPFVSKK